jgi:hypothetical protein
MLDNYREVRERYDFQMGSVRGGLATALDVLTDALALVGQHGVYCRSTRQPQFPSMDVRIVMQQIEDSKALIIEAMEQLKRK